jgi:hypothetical protein
MLSAAKHLNTDVETLRFAQGDNLTTSVKCTHLYYQLCLSSSLTLNSPHGHGKTPQL